VADVQTLNGAAAVAPAPPVPLRERYGLFIGGDWVAAQSSATFPTINPATEEPLAAISLADPTDVDRAVRAARRGFDKYWRKLRASERAKYIYRLARAVAERSGELATLESLDSGKPIAEAREFDVPQAATYLFYHAGWADKLEWILRSSQRSRPLGVVGAIVPWNFPLLLAVWKIAPALACGNAIVLKPSEATPLSTLALASIAVEADLPPGVLNVVTGDARTGMALAEHGDLDKLSFTGSTEVGKAIRRAAAGTRKRLTLELGGKSALILYDDAPLDQAIEGIVAAIYFNRGHMCCAGSRLLVHESIAREVGERLRDRIDRLRLGNPLREDTDIGPLATRSARDRVAEYVRTGIEEGATLVEQSAALPERGYYVRAAFFAAAGPSQRIAREEIAGPVLCVLTFRTPAEAIALANDVPYGLSAGVWTENGALALYTAQRLTAGVIWCNTFNRSDPSAPFGGYKESGFGREGGVHGLLEYLAS
jgi:aldehyde dehydrogenase (NAD+)